MLVDLLEGELGTDTDGNPVFLRDIWPSTEEIQSVIDECVRSEMFESGYATCITATTHGGTWMSPPVRCSSGRTIRHMCGAHRTSTG